MIKVSVIVAVYNTAPYLRQCLDSLMRQSLRDIEVLCVDDGSSDSSPTLLRAYAECDARIKPTFLKENMGLAHARNVALAQATGEYVCFLDSDDWFADDALEKVYKAFTADIDTVLFHLVLHYEDGKEQDFQMQPFDTLSGEEAFKESLTWQIHGVYAIRNTIHQAFPYDETQKTYTDENVTHVHYLRSRKVALCSGTYFYRQRSSSVTHRVSGQRFDFLLANERLHQQLLSLRVSDEIIAFYETKRWLNLVGLYFFYYRHRRSLSPSDRRRGLDIMHHVWATINLSLVRPSLRRKFGYCPLRRSWLLFRLQEELYFWLRGIIKGNE